MPTFWHQSKTKEEHEELIRSLNVQKTKKDSKVHIYILAAIAGVGAAALLIGGLKLGIIIIKAAWAFLKEYWIWVAVGIIGLLFLRKILSRRRVEVHREKYPEQNYQ